MAHDRGTAADASATSTSSSSARKWAWRGSSRLCERVDLDLDDPTERLVAELQLRLLAP